MKLKALMCAAAVCGSVFSAVAEEPAKAEEKKDAKAEEAAKVEQDEPQLVSVSFAAAFDSKYLSYGFVDNRAPIVTPSAELTILDTLTIGVEAIFDVTTYGKKAGYGNRGAKYTELHPYIGLSHSFSPDDYSFLPTTVDVGLSWLYEYHPEAKARHGDRDPGADDDTQFWTLEIGLPDLWLEPTFTYERDVIRDNGTYLALEIGHTFSLIDGENEDDDPVLSLRPSIAQGFGNRQRVDAYAGYTDVNGDDRALGRACMLDTFAKLELNWQICDYVALSGYVGYSDFLFGGSDLRKCARQYEATGAWDESWNIVAGCALSVGF